MSGSGPYGPRLIGLSGKKRAGKDTAAQVLVEHYGYTQIAFADAMRAAALALDPIVDVYLVGDECCGDWTEHDRLGEIVAESGWENAKEQYPEVRRTLQRLGTEVGRNLFGEDFWVERTLAEVAKIPGPVVITDVRFPNEARAVEALPDSAVYRIERPSLRSTDTHESETALDDYPFEHVIQNDGSIADLHSAIRHMLVVHEVASVSRETAA